MSPTDLADHVKATLKREKPMTLRIYIVNKTPPRFPGAASVVIVAESAEAAADMYESFTGELPYSLVEEEIRDGIVLIARGPNEMALMVAEKELGAVVPVGPVQ